MLDTFIYRVEEEDFTPETFGICIDIIRNNPDFRSARMGGAVFRNSYLDNNDDIRFQSFYLYIYISIYLLI
jgi:hypothetical protein